MEIKSMSGEEWLQRLENLPRQVSNTVTAFYEHRVGAICTDTRYLLVPLDDHLVHRGDGIFESLTLAEGKILELNAHMERLERCVKSLRLSLPCSFDEVREVIIAVAKAGKSSHGSLKILVGRGEGGMGISPKECPKASFYCVASKGHPLPVSFWEKGLTACKSKIPAKQEFIAQIKSTNYLPNVFMAQEAEERGVDVSFSFDAQGYLAEAAIANVGIIDKEGNMLLPHFRYSLPGTTALLAMELAKKYLAEELKSITTANISEQDMYDAKEVFLLGTGPECVGITHFEGRAITDGKPGGITQKLKALIHDSLLATGTAFL